MWCCWQHIKTCFHLPNHNHTYSRAISTLFLHVWVNVTNIYPVLVYILDSMVVEKKTHIIIKCMDRLLQKSIIQFSHELTIHAISIYRYEHIWVNQSLLIQQRPPTPFLQTPLCPSPISKDERDGRNIVDAVSDVPAYRVAWGQFSSLLPCSLSILLWPVLDTLVAFSVYQ